MLQADAWSKGGGRMIIERAEVLLTAGREDEFIHAMEEARKILASAKGCHAVTVCRGIEDPSKIVLLVEWDSVESHVAFTREPEFAAFGGMVGRFLAGAPSVEHFAKI
jgi:heme-degrading monooxygenase HmoA